MRTLINFLRRKFLGETRERQQIRDSAADSGLSQEFVARMFSDAKKHGMKITYK